MNLQATPEASAFTRIWHIVLVALIATALPLAADAQQVTVHITSDNAYVFGFGDVNGVQNIPVGLVDNTLAGDIYLSYGPETYTIPSNADLSQAYIYIIAYSDKKTYQGTVALFSDGTHTVTTNQNSQWPWEVYATGTAISPMDITTINGYVSTANAYGGSGGTTSKGWVRTAINQCTNGTSACEGRLTFCDQFTLDRWNSGSMNYWNFKVDQGTRFMWYQPPGYNGTGELCDHDFAGQNDTREHLIFRIGPIGGLLGPPCCEEGFTRVSINSFTPWDQNTGLWRILAKITSGVLPVKRVRASMVYYSRSSMGTTPPEACTRCIQPVANYGSIVKRNGKPGNISGVHVLSPVLADLDNISQSDESGRDVTWSNVNGYNTDLRTGRWITIPIQVPPPVDLPDHCCSDTIRVCMRYTITDSLCHDCDTVICYQGVQTHVSGNPIPIQDEFDDQIGPPPPDSQGLFIPRAIDPAEASRKRPTVTPQSTLQTSARSR
jgi:hypothetical protein